MKLLNAMILSAVLLCSVVLTAKAADPSSTTSAIPPQVAANPGIPYSSSRMPGPKAGPSNWIPSPYSAVPAARSNLDAPTAGSSYSGQTYGPKPN
jgi:hypothetical protein